MRKPAGRNFTQIANVFSLPSYALTKQSPQINTDQEGGFSPAYPTLPTQKNVRCMIQFVSDMEETDEIGRISEYRMYHMFFREDPIVNVRDMIQWVDNNAVTRTAFVRSSKDMGFYGVIFRVEAVERI